MVLSVLLYGGAESWVLSTDQLHRLEVLHNGWLRFITGDTVGHPDSISTQALLEKTNQMSIASMLRVRRLRWLGHVARKPDTSMVKQLLFANSVPGCVLPVGRPRKSWVSLALADLKKLGCKVNRNNLVFDWPLLCLDRVSWKRDFVDLSRTL
jgi:hypothetical protein